MRYWWRSQFSCLASNEFKLRVSIIFDFATSTTSGAYSLLAMIQQIGEWRNLSEKIVQWEGVALPAE